MKPWKMTDRRRAEMKAAIAKIEKAIERGAVTYDEMQAALDDLQRKFEAYHSDEK